MALAYFSVGDLQSVWEQGGQDAYFANNNGYGGMGGSVNTSTPARPVLRGSMGGSPGNRPKPKLRQNVRVRNANGTTFFKNVEINAEKAYNAVKGAAKNAGGAAVRAAEGTAGYGARAVESAGRGAVNTGGFVRDRANQLGGAIRNNPRMAGAVILGGTALGVGGGAYALSRRDDN